MTYWRWGDTRRSWLLWNGAAFAPKSTFHGDVSLDLSMVVVDEITLVGSRCGPFLPALRLLEQQLVDVESLIHDTFSLDDGLAAFERATARTRRHCWQLSLNWSVF